MTFPWRTLRGRLALASTVGLIAASLAFALLGIELVRTQTVSEEIADLKSTATGIAGLMSEDAATAVQSAEENSYNPSTARIALFEGIAGPGTDILYWGFDLSPGAPSTLPSAVSRELDRRALEKGEVLQFDYRDPNREGTRIAAAAPITLFDDVVGAAVLARDRAAVTSVWRRVANRVMFAALIGLLFAILVTTLLTRKVMKPLTRFQHAAARVGQGDLETRVAREGTEEIDALGDAFNRMVAELHHREQLSRDFLMRVTHDLRTPLTAIRGHSQALIDGVVPEDAVPRSLDAIEDGCDRLEGLITDLLDLAKLEARRFRLELDTVDGNDLIARAFNAYAAEAARRDISYELIGDPLPILFTDGKRVRQIVSNLIDNAFRWTPDSGKVTVAAYPRIGGGKGATVFVTDSGPGIPADRHESIFEPFRSEDLPDGRHGSGLGLTISRQLARALGGDLTLESEVGRGTRFILDLAEEIPRREPEDLSTNLTPQRL